MEQPHTTTNRDLKKQSSILKDNKGFTLIELAIVLVIIGLILGSVLKGKDLINSAKQKQFYNAFVKTWELSIVSYYDRSGYLLGDGAVNGGTAAAPNGVFDGRLNSAAEFGRIDTALETIGLQVTETNTANSYEFSFTGAYSGNQTIALVLQNVTNGGQARNTMLFENVPIDVAYSLDKIIDGQVDATAGKCVLNGWVAGDIWGDASGGGVATIALTLDVP